MKKRQMSGRLSIDYRCFFLAAVLLLLFPVKWIFAWLLASLAHEMGHYLAVRLLGGTVCELKLTCRGAKMCASPLPPDRQLICILAGPMTSFSLLLFWEEFPQLAFCGAVQGAYNLLPIGNLDGWNALACLKFRKKPCKDGEQRVQ